MRRTSATIALLVLLSEGRLEAQVSAGPTAPKVGQDGKDVEWLPTRGDTGANMLDLANVQAGDTVIDLGSGDGRLVIAAAQRGATSIGVEYDASLVAVSIDRATKAGVADRATFIRADLFDVDLSQATVITMFLLPDLNMKLRPRLLQLAPGTRIVSNTWDMEDWEPDGVIRLDCPQFCNALLWVVPANVEGRWRLQDGELRLRQTFQTFSGTLTIRNQTTPITGGRLRGDQIEFEAVGARYAGRATREGMTGTVTAAGGGARAWTATRRGPE